MAHFYGTLQGARGEATRLGTKNSGLHTTACSYEGKVRVVLDFDEKLGKDIATVSLAKHMGQGVEVELFSGPVGEEPPKDVLPGVLAAAKGMIHYATTAPATDPGEGWWEDLDAAFAAGAKQAEFEAAKLMRQFLRKLGIESEGMDGYALCPGCSRSLASGEHDPDCTLKDNDEDEDEDDADLEEAAEGETCDGCGRASIDCSRDPCKDVIADREGA